MPLRGKIPGPIPRRRGAPPLVAAKFLAQYRGAAARLHLMGWESKGCLTEYCSTNSFNRLLQSEKFCRFAAKFLISRGKNVGGFINKESSYFKCRGFYTSIDREFQGGLNDVSRGALKRIFEKPDVFFIFNNGFLAITISRGDKCRGCCTSIDREF